MQSINSLPALVSIFSAKTKTPYGTPSYRPAGRQLGTPRCHSQERLLFFKICNYKLKWYYWFSSVFVLHFSNWPAGVKKDRKASVVRTLVFFFCTVNPEKSRSSSKSKNSWMTPNKLGREVKEKIGRSSYAEKCDILHQGIKRSGHSARISPRSHQTHQWNDMPK